LEAKISQLLAIDLSELTRENKCISRRFTQIGCTQIFAEQFRGDLRCLISANLREKPLCCYIWNFKIVCHGDRTFC
jgi:hypothetical protein